MKKVNTRLNKYDRKKLGIKYKKARWTTKGHCTASMLIKTKDK